MHNAMPWMVAGALMLAGVGAEAGQAAPPRAVRAEVATVDENRGTVTLRLPADAVKGLRKGDHVTIRVAGPGKEKPAGDAHAAPAMKSP
jgi:hypothetical protein